MKENNDFHQWRGKPNLHKEEERVLRPALREKRQGRGPVLWLGNAGIRCSMEYKLESWLLRSDAACGRVSRTEREYLGPCRSYRR